MLSSSLKNKIINSYASHKDLELEARFGAFHKKGFSSGVSRQTFNRVKAYFEKNSTAITQKTTDYIMGKVRKSVDVNGGVVWMTKERLWNQDNRDYNLRYSMSREILVDPITTHFKADVIREKLRSSYYVFGDAVRIDLTQVNMIQSNYNKDDTVFEVEIELIDTKALIKFEQAVNITLRLVLDTLVLYTQEEKIKIANETNSILGSSKRGYVDHYPLVQARNLKLRDMVFGGLVGNGNTGYSVTHKTDGERRMLVFSKSGVWLLSSSSMTRVSDKNINTLTGTILDGELVPVDKRLKGAPKTKYWFLAFDCLSWNSNKSIQDKPHKDRMQYAQQVADTMKGDLIRVNTKNYHVFETPDEFFKTMRDMFKQQLILPYMQDGFMFTPENTVYNPHSDKMPLYKRKLTDYPDVCKWKPKEELTIDLLIRWKADPEVPGRRILQLFSNERGKPVPFEKFENVDVENVLTFNLPSETVVEYAYDYDKEMLTPIRVRFDKKFPNKKDVAEDVAEDIRQPLDSATMQGDTFTLLRKYHNSIKKELFNTAKGKTLLDIGSGYGGDLGKWRSYDKIVAVEPDLEHIQEMEKRLQTYNMQDKVKIVHAGGEETEKITATVKEWLNGKADTVSSMLSLTFFWQKSELVTNLVNTISENLKVGGNYVFLTMDGDLVEQTFRPALGTGQALNKLKLGPATLEYDGDVVPQELYIDIEGTIVEKQKEWLVRLDDLKIRLEKYGFLESMMKKANQEKFLTDSELIMTKMYTYGMFKKEREGVEVEKSVTVASVPKNDIPLNVPVKPIELPPLKAKPLPSVATPVLPPLKMEIVEKPVAEKVSVLPMDISEKVKVENFSEPVYRIGTIVDDTCFLHAVLNAYLKYYQTDNDKNFRQNFAKQLKKDIDYKDENFKTVADALNIDIYILRMEENSLKVYTNTGEGKKSVVIAGDNCHYETIGVKRNNLYQTFFNPDDIFIQKMI